MSDTLSYEQLVELVVALRAELAERDARIAELTERVAELERRLGQNSRNSSKPPSSDGPEAPTRRSRRGTGRRPGKQPGAPGSTLARVGCPDEIIDHVPDCCRRCRKDLAGAEPAGVVCRQVHDIPEIRPHVVEHRMHRRRCGCGQVTTAAAPAGVSACVLYGPNVSALAVYLLVYQHIPVARTAELIEQVCGLAVSTGWVCRALQVTAEALAEVEQTIKTLITLGHLVHVDETSTNITGARWWLHVASTQKLTAYFLHRCRGRAAVDAFGSCPDSPAPRCTTPSTSTTPTPPPMPLRGAPGPGTDRGRRSPPPAGLAARRPGCPARAQ